MGIEIEHDRQKIDDIIKSIKKAEGIVAFTSPYSIYVEFPTEYKDDPPPFYAILGWVKIKFGLKDEEAKSVAGKVQNKIYEDGTDGVYFATDTVQEYKGKKGRKILEQYKNSDDVNAPEKIVRQTLDESLEDSKARIVERDAVATGFTKESGIVVMGVESDKTHANTL